MRDDERSSFLNYLAGFFQGFHSPGDAYPMGPHQETQLFVSEGKPDGITFMILDAVFFGHVDQNMVKPIFQVGERSAAHPAGEPVDAFAQVFDNL